MDLDLASSLRVVLGKPVNFWNPSLLLYKFGFLTLPSCQCACEKAGEHFGIERPGLLRQCLILSSNEQHSRPVIFLNTESLDLQIGSGEGFRD